MKNLNLLSKLGVVALVLVASAANATPSTPYDAITGAVDWADVATGIGTIAALIAAVFVIRKGARMLISFLK